MPGGRVRIVRRIAQELWLAQYIVGIAVIRILSHNVLWFQGYPYEEPLPGPPHAEVVAGLADVYRGLGPELLCLQETPSPDALREVGARLAMRGAFCAGSRQPAYSGGVLWKGAAEVVRSSQSNGAAPVRFWQVIALQQDETPLYVANVHLASGRHMTPEEAECSRVDDLHTLLDAESLPHVIAGDFNEGPGGPAAAYLYGRGYEDAALLFGVDLPSTGIGKARSDQIWLHESVRARASGFGALSWNALRIPDHGVAYLSDHLPLWLELRETP